MNKYIYQRVRDLREDNDYTQADIAKILKLHLTQYRRYENGETEIPVHILIELAKLYGTTIDRLVEIQIIKKK